MLAQTRQYTYQQLLPPADSKYLHIAILGQTDRTPNTLLLATKTMSFKVKERNVSTVSLS